MAGGQKGHRQSLYVKYWVRGYLAMTNIIISHKKECGENWRPFNKKSIEKVIEEIWDKHVKGSTPYLALKKTYKGDEDDLSPKCYYLRDSERGDKALVLFGGYHGCVFDLDAYYECIEYLKTEVESLPSTVFGGGISKSKKDYTPKPEVETLLFHKPINDKNELVPYLQVVLILIRAAIDPDFETALKNRVGMEYKTLERFSVGGPICR
jgi:hypothetical protein